MEILCYEHVGSWAKNAVETSGYPINVILASD